MKGIAAPNPLRRHGPPVALLAAACGGGSSAGSPGVAKVASSSASRLSSPGSSASHDPLAFSRCSGSTEARTPDPGGPTQAGPGSGLDPSDPTCQANRQACQSLLPTANTARAAQRLASASAT
jgi:hypothetical protein